MNSSYYDALPIWLSFFAVAKHPQSSVQSPVLIYSIQKAPVAKKNVIFPRPFHRARGFCHSAATAVKKQGIFAAKRPRPKGEEEEGGNHSETGYAPLSNPKENKRRTIPSSRRRKEGETANFVRRRRKKRTAGPPTWKFMPMSWRLDDPPLSRLPSFSFFFPLRC